MDDTQKGQPLKLIVIVPAFNEQERIDATISALLAEKPIFASKNISLLLYVIDDGSNGMMEWDGMGMLRAPITNITIESSTFVPRDKNIRFGFDDDKKTLGIGVDTIEIKSAAF